jgi:hypothetical protein
MYLLPKYNSSIFNILNSFMRFLDLKKLMDEPLPSKSLQRSKPYRPKMREVKALFRLINREIFYNRLPMPLFEIRRLKDCIGMCYGREGPIRKTKSHCTLYLADRYYCRQWFISTLAHEMVHQYQWDVYSNILVKRGYHRHMSHGPTFYIWRKKLAKYNIALKSTVLKDKHWFTHQDVTQV